MNWIPPSKARRDQGKIPQRMTLEGAIKWDTGQTFQGRCAVWRSASPSPLCWVQAAQAGFRLARGRDLAPMWQHLLEAAARGWGQIERVLKTLLGGMVPQRVQEWLASHETSAPPALQNLHVVNG